MFNDINHIWWVGGPHLQNLNSTPIDELLCDKAALKIWAGKINPTWHQPAQANRLHTAHFHILGHLSWNYKCHPMTLFNPKDNLPYLTNITEPEKLSNCWLFKFNTTWAPSRGHGNTFTVSKLEILKFWLLDPWCYCHLYVTVILLILMLLCGQK